MLQRGLGIAILVVGLSLQANGYNEPDSQSCRDGRQPIPASNGTTASIESVASSSKPHSVRLSWMANIPVSSSPDNAILGYNVFRRDPGTEYEKINKDLMQHTGCVDYLVTSGHTYYYETKAVSANGLVSKPSPEVQVVIPFR